MEKPQGSDQPQFLTRRRHVISAAGATLFGAVAGCSALPRVDASEKPVDVLVQNDDTVEWQVTVALEDDVGEEVFRAEEVVPADTGEDLGEVLIEEAVMGRTGDQFTVHV